jgi:hypothetical protein
MDRLERRRLWDCGVLLGPEESREGVVTRFIVTVFQEGFRPV